jgi:hypothetical protein
MLNHRLVSLCLLSLSVIGFGANSFADSAAAEKAVTCDLKNSNDKFKFYPGDFKMYPDQKAVRMKKGHSGMFGGKWDETVGDAAPNGKCSDNCFDVSGDFSFGNGTYTITASTRMSGSQLVADITVSTSEGDSSGPEIDNCVVTSEAY